MNPLDVEPSEAPAGYRLGDPIALEDLLALPPDGRRYTRDEEGRLTLMSPDDARHHRIPLNRLTARLNRLLPEPWFVAQEPSLTLPRIVHLLGDDVGPSRLGKRAIEPDVVVLEDEPEVTAGDPDESGRWTLFGTRGVRLVIELVSPGSWGADLGLGRADRVDRWRTYLLNGVPEYWVLNPGAHAGPLPPRSGLFLANAGDAWRALEVEDARGAEGQVHGFRPVAGGRVRSRAVPELVCDVEALWTRGAPG